MYDKTPYTPGMREVIKYSKAEAGRLGHDTIGPEHYLLGIVRKGDGLAVQVLINMEVGLEELRMEVERQIQPGKGPIVKLFSPNAEAMRTLNATKDAARELGHAWIGTEHLLLGIVRCENTAAAKALAAFGVNYANALEGVLEVIAGTNSKSAKDDQEQHGTMRAFRAAASEMQKRLSSAGEKQHINDWLADVSGGPKEYHVKFTWRHSADDAASVPPAMDFYVDGESFEVRRTQSE